MKRAKKQEDRLMIEFERRKSHFTGFDFNRFIIPAWIMIVTGSLIWNWNHIQSDFIDIANANARMSLEKDLNYRRWASMHGGVYVPVTEDTPPNPYLVHHGAGRQDADPYEPCLHESSSV
jgi:hypothetical protein